ncbi:hypothetical protein TNCV_3191451 [Trichonephila clavipes]|nr:hypothetical protein TNCV_3191451 [Trichonephila clavipes]
MIEWSARRVSRQLGHFDCVVRSGGTSGSESMSFTRRPAQNVLDRPVVKKTEASVFGGIGHRTQAFRSGVRCSNH